jgi:hypothetical protein
MPNSLEAVSMGRFDRLLIFLLGTCACAFAVLVYSSRPPKESVSWQGTRVDPHDHEGYAAAPASETGEKPPLERGVLLVASIVLLCIGAVLILFSCRADRDGHALTHENHAD